MREEPAQAATPGSSQRHRAARARMTCLRRGAGLEKPLGHLPPGGAGEGARAADSLTLPGALEARRLTHSTRNPRLSSLPG